jgi:hypothetical protein
MEKNEEKMSLNEYYDKALTYDEYIDLLGENLSLHQLHYKKFYLSDENVYKISLLNSYRILVITEPWCGDSLALLPVIRKVSESRPDWEMKVIRRDENPGLIDQYLTNGARAIPIFLFLDEKGKPVLKWGPRPDTAQQIFEDHRNQINSGELDKKEVIKKIRTFYAKNRGKAAFEDFFDKINEIKI